MNYTIDTQKFTDWLSRNISAYEKKEKESREANQYASALEYKILKERDSAILSCVKNGYSEFMVKNDTEECKETEVKVGQIRKWIYGNYFVITKKYTNREYTIIESEYNSRTIAESNIINNTRLIKEYDNVKDAIICMVNSFGVDADEDND